MKNRVCSCQLTQFQKDFSKELLRGEGTAEDAARRIQSRASLYMTEQYG